MRTYATIQQAFDAYQAMPPDEKRRIKAIAREAWKGTSYSSGEDLESQARDTFLSGRRRWPMDIDFAHSFRTVLRSVANNDRKLARNRHDLNVRIDQDISERERAAAELAMRAPSAEDVIDSLQQAAMWEAWAEKVRAKLRPHDEALFIFDAKRKEMARAEIIDCTGMDLQTYKSAWKQVARVCAKTPKPK
jgi:hypothetical protein